MSTSSVMAERCEAERRGECVPKLDRQGLKLGNEQSRGRSARSVELLILLLLAGLVCCGQYVIAAANPSADDRDRQQLQESVDTLSKKIVDSPNDDELYSQRGDAQFFLGKFKEAVADYDKMVELKPELDASHWRRGIAYFYAGRYADGAAQFDRYHSFDDVDRENGIWRYLSQAMDKGRDEAQKELLRYEKDDREPFSDVYKLFAGNITPDQILANIAAAKVNEQEREKREFYAHLYIGLHLSVLKENEQAVQHLAKAADNTWAPTAGYGPHYMWCVAKLHHAQLKEELTPKQSRADFESRFPATRCGCRF
jgi:lipoprotein NlpI